MKESKTMNTLDQVELLLKQLAKAQTSLEQSQAETNVQIAKSQVRMEQTDKRLSKKLKEIGMMVGGISNNQGDIAEEFFVNSIAPSQKVGGRQYDMMYKNLSKNVQTCQKMGLQDEYDIVLVNGNEVAIIEVKYKAHDQDLARLLNKKHPNFKKLYPEYSDYKHHLGLASFHINDDLKQQALEQGVMVLQRKGDLVETTCPA